MYICISLSLYIYIYIHISLRSDLRSGAAAHGGDRRRGACAAHGPPPYFTLHSHAPVRLSYCDRSVTSTTPC